MDTVLDVDCMLIANDAIMKDDIRKTTLKLAKPNGVKACDEEHRGLHYGTETAGLHGQI